MADVHDFVLNLLDGGIIVGAMLADGGLHDFVAAVDETLFGPLAVARHIAAEVTDVMDATHVDHTGVVGSLEGLLSRDPVLIVIGL